MINKISFKNYKLFKEKQTLELKPLTILIGKNNSGKSAVLKLPTMISASLRGDFSAPLELKNDDVVIGLSYEDLFYNREITTSPLEFQIESENEKLEFSISGNRNYNIHLSKYVYNEKEINVKGKFNGLISSEVQIKSMNLNFDYIDSFRKFPSPQFSDVFSEYNKVGLSGENAFKLMAQYHKNRKSVLEDIKKWFKENFEGWEINIKDISGSVVSYEIVLSNEKITDINIFNTGSGIKQSLPLIVRSYMPVEVETLIIIEEPETHLHPSAHGDLAERFVNSYKEDNRRKYLIETHSENFILRIQRLIADKTLTKDDVKIYYVDYDEKNFCSNLKEIIIEEDGEFEDWPDNIFNESLDEVIKLRKAQKER